MDGKFGLPAWKAHVHGWLLDRPAGVTLTVLKYEELVAAPEEKLALTLDAWGFHYLADWVSQAVKESSKENMKASEEAYRAASLRYEFEFVGGQHTEKVDREWVGQLCADELDALGYR